MKVIVTSGFFNPLHSGHIECFEAARALGDRLIVGVNSDAAQIKKSGRCFLPLLERLRIVGALRCVDDARSFNDDDGTACALLRDALRDYPEAEIVFAKGGDRQEGNVPEVAVVNPRLSFVYGVGGRTKQNSSSSILSAYAAL